MVLRAVIAVVYFAHSLTDVLIQITIRLWIVDCSLPEIKR